MDSLKSIQELCEQESLLLTRFLEDPAPHNTMNKRISSTSTVKSVFYDSTPPGSSPRDPLQTELNLLMSLRPVGRTYFNVLLAGDSGVGKSCFIDIYRGLKFLDLASSLLSESSGVFPATEEITHHRLQRVYGAFEFFLDLIDSPGHGSFRDIKGWTAYIARFITKSSVNYYKTKEAAPVDSRVHLCLYFHDATLRTTDLFALKELHRLVPIIPVLAKADTYTQEELRQAKTVVREQAFANFIKFFDCENAVGTLKNELSCGPLGPCAPFALVSAVKHLESNGECVYGREYPWGICDLNDPNHSDFQVLDKFLLSRFAHFSIQETRGIAKDLYRKHLQDKARRNRDTTTVRTVKLLASAASVLSLSYFLTKHN